MNNNTECIATPAPGRLCVVISAVLWALKSLWEEPRPISVRAAAFSYRERLRFVPLVILFQTDMGDLTAVIPALVRSGNLQTRRLLNLNFALRFFLLDSRDQSVPRAAFSGVPARVSTRGLHGMNVHAWPL